MKTTEKTFDAVNFMRQQRDRLTEKLANMTKEEIREYFNKSKTRNKVKPGA
jgi:c-di-AMP phosphodiesterase-like protein